MNGGARCALALAWIIALGVVAPVFSGARDSFPYSTYPMFTADRRYAQLVVMVFADRGEDPVKVGRRVIPQWVSGQEVLMAAATIRRAHHAGPAAMGQLCREVRERASSQGQKLGALAFVIEHIDVLSALSQDTAAGRRELVWMCPPPRSL